MQTESALGGGTLLPGISFMTLLLRNNGAQSIINWLSADMFGDSEPERSMEMKIRLLIYGRLDGLSKMLEV